MNKGERQIRTVLESEVSKEEPDPRDGEHYGPYGIACSSTGQFDAGECWKCQIKRLKEERNTAMRVSRIITRAFNRFVSEVNQEKDDG